MGRPSKIRKSLLISPFATTKMWPLKLTQFYFQGHQTISSILTTTDKTSFPKVHIIVMVAVMQNSNNDKTTLSVADATGHITVDIPSRYSAAANLAMNTKIP